MKDEKFTKNNKLFFFIIFLLEKFGIFFFGTVEWKCFREQVL